MALGIAFSTKADLGVSPISCVPYVISICPGATWSMGAITFAMHVCFVLAQIALLRRNFRVAQLAQLGVEGAADAIVAAALSAFRKEAAQKRPGKKAAARGAFPRNVSAWGKGVALSRFREIPSRKDPAPRPRNPSSFRSARSLAFRKISRRAAKSGP